MNRTLLLATMWISRDCCAHVWTCERASARQLKETYMFMSILHLHPMLTVLHIALHASM